MTTRTSSKNYIILAGPAAGCGVEPTLAGAACSVQADAKARFLKMAGHNVTLVATAGAMDPRLLSGAAHGGISTGAPEAGQKLSGAPGTFLNERLDAPIDALAGIASACRERGRDWAECWNDAVRTRRYVFSGHESADGEALSWPLVLESAGFRAPDKSVGHGRVLFEGAVLPLDRLPKLDRLLTHIPAEALRLHLLSLINGDVADIGFDIDACAEAWNRDVLLLLGGLPVRAAALLEWCSRGELAAELADPFDFQTVLEDAGDIIIDYEFNRTGAVIDRVFAILGDASAWLDELQQHIDETDRGEVQRVLTQVLFMVRAGCILLQPVLPETTRRCLALFNEDGTEPLPLGALADLPFCRRIGAVEPLGTALDAGALRHAIRV